MAANGIDMARDRRDDTAAFRHEALLYEDGLDFLDGTVPFLREGIERGEATMVAVGEEKERMLREEIGGAGAEEIAFVDMERLGRNPARIIPAWRDFVGDHGGADRPLRGIGEPAWAGRSENEYAECDRHESLLNLAFGETTGFWLLCPYDIGALDDDVLDAARRDHPVVAQGGARRHSDDYVDPAEASPFSGALEEFTGEVASLGFGAGDLRALRAFVAAQCDQAGLDRWRHRDLVLAADELATNSIRHGGGGGILRLWREPEAVVCEVRDRGTITEPLVGRARPDANQATGRGLWIVNEVCDLVQIRALAGGNVVRVRMSLG